MYDIIILCLIFDASSITFPEKYFFIVFLSDKNRKMIKI